MGLYLNKGNALFKRALNSKIYVDKSKLISYTNNVLDTENEYICDSRPRRFGKSMTANMLAAYYDKNCDSMLLFKNLDIKNDKTYKQHLNKYDVIYFDIQQILEDSGKPDNFINYIQKEVITELEEEYPGFVKPGETSLPRALETIFSNPGSGNKGFIIIIDEWDCIFREAQNDFNIHKQYLGFLKNLFKGRSYIKLAYMTGILPIKKYGSHSALNIFDEFSMTDPAMLAEYAGFTENEVTDLCQKHNLDFNEMQYWYNGYLAYNYNTNEVFIPNHEIREEFITATRSSGWN